MNNSGCVIFYSFKCVRLKNEKKKNKTGQFLHFSKRILSEKSNQKKKEKEAFGSTDLCTQKKKKNGKKSRSV